MNSSKLQELIQSKIPITKSLGLSVLKSDLDEVLLQFPLENNKNHIGTGFGGSIMSSEALACWAWYLLRCAAEGIEATLVVKTANIRFLRPVKEDFQVRCAGLSDSEWASVVADLKQKGSASFTLTADVLCQAKLCSQFKGQFVINNAH